MNIVRKLAKSIVIAKGKVTINGKTVDTKADKKITIIVKGNCGKIVADNCLEIEVHGDVEGNVETMSGDVTCKNIGGKVSTMSGDVRSRLIGGNAETLSGDINL